MKKTSYVPGTPNWVHLATTDVDKACTFYGRLLGWTFDAPDPSKGGYVNATKTGERVAGIRPADKGEPTQWETFFASKDAAADAQAIEKAGGRLLVKPDAVGDEGTMAVALDPTGAAFGLWQPDRHKGAGLFGETGAMVWHELMTGDVEKALPFYVAVLGVTTKQIQPGYHVLEKAGQGHGGITDLSQGIGGRPEWLVYFAVDDADASAKQIKELGGKVISPPDDTPYGVMAVAEDPAGARFAIIKPKP